MARSKLLDMGPCEECGSSDACGSYEDGSRKCHKCGAKYDGESQPDVSGLDLSLQPIALTARKLSAATCGFWSYGRVTYKGRPVQAAALTDRSGQVVGYKLRFPDKTFVKLGRHKEAEPLWGMHLWRDAGRRVVITEGEIDAMTVSQLQEHKWPVVSLPDGAGSAEASIKAAMDWLSGFETVVLAFDMDEVGRKAAKEAAVLFKPGQARIATLPGDMKDANDMLKAGRSKELINALWNAREYRPDGLVMGDDILTHLGRPMPKGEPWPFEQLDAKTLGIRPGEIVTLCAGSGVGKSSFARQVAADLARRGHRVGYFALEESVQVSALGMIGALCGRPLRLLEDPAAEPGYREARDTILKNAVFYDHFGSIGDSTLLNRIRYAVQAAGCQYVVLDHLSIVVSGMEGDNERRMIDNVMTQLRSFVEETRVALILVSHLRRRPGKGFENGVRPRMSDLRGSAGIEQLSDIIVGLARDLMTDSDEERSLVEVSVLKNRWTGDTGPAGVLRYDADTGLMSSTDEEFAPTTEDDDF